LFAVPSKAKPYVRQKTAVERRSVMLDQMTAIRPEPEVEEGPTRHRALLDWVAELADHLQPETVRWCDGSEA